MPKHTEASPKLDVNIETNVENADATDTSPSSPAKANLDGTANNEETPKYNLSKFRLNRILYNNSVRKSIALLGSFPDVSSSDPAIVIFEKEAFQDSDVATYTSDKSDDDNDEKKPTKPSYFNNDLKVHKDFINNIYGSYQCVSSAELNGVRATVVYPASNKHIEKHSICQKYLINETPTLYETITLPYITDYCQFSLDWVHNILEHKQETDRIVFEDEDPENGFILLPDLKWDGHTVETLYLLAIIHKHNIKSLRDLNTQHLPLLRNIRSSATAVIAEKYDLHASQLRMYFHYQPSFYHLHVHINIICKDAPGIMCEKSHLLDTVINNLELMPDYYERATLPFIAYEGSKLLDLYDEKIAVRKSVQTEESRTVASNDEPECKRIKLDVAGSSTETICAQ